MKRFLLMLSPIVLAIVAGSLPAADADNLLPVEQAFKVEAKAVDRGSVRFDFKIADDYYLYRERVKVKSNDASVTLGALDMPDGEKKHDEFLGDVEVYHHGFIATQHVTAPADADKISLELRYQGCHQVDPKICFPPQKVNLSILLPKAATSDVGNSLAASLSTPASTSLLDNGSPLPVEQAFVFEAIATGPGEILARFTMPKNYYLYRDKTHFSTESKDITLGAPTWPAGKEHTDANFGKTTVYFNQIEIPIPLTRTNTSAQNVAITANFQGCLENSVCYPETSRTVDVPLPAGVATATAAAPNSESENGGDSQFKRALNGSIWFAFGVFFLAGLGLAFTPCVFPMIPILSGIIAGAGENLSTRRAIVLSVVYVLANAVIFTIAGVIAGLAGKNLQAAFQTPWVLWCFAGLFVVLALSMFGFYELQLPTALQSKIANVSNKQSGGSLSGVAIMGALSALIVGPCVTPPLAVAVLYIAQKHDAVLGGFALFTLALGMGAPLVVFGASAGKLLPRAGAWMDAVKAVFGVTFLALAIWMLSRILDATWIMLMAGVLMLACAVYLGALERLPENASGWKKLWKTLGVVLLSVARQSSSARPPDRTICCSRCTASEPAQAQRVRRRQRRLPFHIVKSIDDVDHELAAAKSAGKPVMLDFYADWCVSCKEMEKFTFTKSEVQSALSNFVLLQADVTANDDTDQALMKHYGIVAPPDTIFFAASGAEQHSLQLTGPEDADKFVKRIQSVR